jgi:hypothetical protein
MTNKNAWPGSDEPEQTTKMPKADLEALKKATASGEEAAKGGAKAPAKEPPGKAADPKKKG